MFGSDEPVAMMIEAVVRLVVWWCGRCSGWPVRDPSPVGALRRRALVVLDRYAGHVGGPGLLVACLVAALALWRWRGRTPTGGMVRPRLRVWLSLTTRASGVASLPGSGLVATTTQRPRPSVRLRCAGRRAGHPGRDRPPAGGDPGGLTLDDYARKADALAVAFGAREARVLCRRARGRCGSSSTTPTSSPQRSDRSRPARPGAEPRGVPIGRHEDGTPWRFSLLADPRPDRRGDRGREGLHPVVAAARAVAGHQRRVGAGVGHRPQGRHGAAARAGLFARFEDGTPETMCDLLEDLVAVMDARAKRLAAQGIRKHHRRRTRRTCWRVIDELATLTAFAERTVVRRIEQGPRTAADQGPRGRDHRPRSGPGPRQGRRRLARPVPDPGRDAPGQPDPGRHGPGRGARDIGATADHISELTPGVAYVRIEGTRAIRRVRAAYLTDDDIADLADVRHRVAGPERARPSKPVDPLDELMAEPVPEPTPCQPKLNAASTCPTLPARPPRKPRKPRKPRNRDGSQVA